MRLYRLALVAAFAVTPARAAESNSVQLVPADAAFFTTSLRLGEQMDAFLKSNAYAKLKSLPATRFALDQLREAANQPDNPAADVLKFFKDPANKELVGLLTKDEDDPKKTEYLGKAAREIERITEVTAKLRNATSIELTDYPGGDSMITVTDESVTATRPPDTDTED